MKRRYAISFHDHPDGAHYDLFLESGSTLATWRLSAPPETGAVDAARIADHRIDYLDYEGPVSGDRGTVRVHARGRYTLDGATLLLEGGASAGAYEFRRENLLVRLVA